jgi:hypothetical protein
VPQELLDELSEVHAAFMQACQEAQLLLPESSRRALEGWQTLIAETTEGLEKASRCFTISEYEQVDASGAEYQRFQEQEWEHVRRSDWEPTERECNALREAVLDAARADLTIRGPGT